jgi:hypothetical protein
MQPPSAAKNAKARARVEEALMRARGVSQGTCLSHPRGPNNKQEHARVQQIWVHYRILGRIFTPCVVDKLLYP